MALTGRLADHAREIFGRAYKDDALGLAAELAYRFLFALFPFAIFIAALGGFVAGALGVEDPSARIISTIGADLPSNLADPVRHQLMAILDKTQPELLSVGGLLSIWAATGAMNSVTKSLNRAFEVPENRPILLRLALAVLLTVVSGLTILVSFVVIVGGALVTRNIVDQLGMGAVWPVLSLLRWPLVFVLLVLAVSALLHFAPARRPAWSGALFGAVCFALAWVVSTWLFAVYVSRFASFDATYGALAGVIVLMLWFYLTAFLLVCAGELAAQVQRHRAAASTVGESPGVRTTKAASPS